MSTKPRTLRTAFSNRYEFEDMAMVLYAHVSKFIREHQISEASSIYQSDKVIEDAYKFVETCCDIVGYYEYPQEDS